MIADVVASAAADSPAGDADMLEILLEACARRDPGAAARLMVDVTRIARGMRVGYDLMNEAMDVTARCLGRTPAVQADPRDWLERWRFFEGVVGRGARDVWIWGAGQRGLDALQWLRQHAVPVARFLDTDSARDGSEWGGLPVQHVKPAITSLDRSSLTPLMVIASMYHPEITSRADQPWLSAWQRLRRLPPGRLVGASGRRHTMIDLQRATRTELAVRLSARSRRSLFVWGAGVAGRAAAAVLADHGVRVAGFIDGDPGKSGMRVEGHVVYAPRPSAAVLRHGRAS